MSWLYILGASIALYYMLRTYIRVEGLQMDVRRLAERVGSLAGAVESIRENVRNICASMEADIGGPKLFDVTSQERAAEIMTEAHIVDVRTPNEYEQGRLPDASNLPADVLPEQLESLPRDRKILVYCERGVRSEKACRLLASNGFENVSLLEGGLDAWKGELEHDRENS